MTSFVHLDYPTQHPGIVRASSAVDALSHGLLARIKALYARWSEQRRQAAEDDKLWQLALTDARVMAELSRAMSTDAKIDIRHYY
jgi:hypothetical protein